MEQQRCRASSINKLFIYVNFYKLYKSRVRILHNELRII